jgi:hypothetical protein
MLRVFKPTSPMSMGSWILAGFGPAASLAAVAELVPAQPTARLGRLAREVLPPVGRVAGWAAAGLAPLLGTYTAVLLSDTAVPAWHEARAFLPFVFSGSALASGAGAGLLLAPPAEAGPARRMAVTGAAAELVATGLLERRLGLSSEAYRAPGPARLLRLSRLLTGAGAVGAAVGRGRVSSSLSGAALLGGSVCTRFGVYRAGVVSAQDPRYTIVPQRQRLDAAVADRPG